LLVSFVQFKQRTTTAMVCNGWRQSALTNNLQMLAAACIVENGLLYTSNPRRWSFRSLRIHHFCISNKAKRQSVSKTINLVSRKVLS